MAERPPGSEEPVETARTSTGHRPETRGSWGSAGDAPAPAPREERSALSFIRELPFLIVLALGLAIVLKTFVVQAFYIPSGSMEPTLAPGDRVLVNKVLYDPGRGDVIVFGDPDDGRTEDRGVVGGFLHWLSEAIGFARPEHEDFIKRVIGLPGETVELRDGKLFVNGERIREPYLRGPVDTRDYGPTEVPRDSLFVLGDNRLNSNDSRFGLGFVPVDKVVGRAFVIVWPPSDVGWVH